MRLIDADVLLNNTDGLEHVKYSQEYGHVVLVCDIVYSSTVDAVEVVRCKDCIHGTPTRIDTVTGEFSDEQYCWCHHMCHPDDYYCADGERIENTMKCKKCQNYEYWFGDNYRCADSGTMVSEDDTCPYWHGKEGCADGS